MKRINAILCVLICSVIIISCQPTPKDEYVTNKGDSLLEQSIFTNNSSVEQPSFPDAIIDTCILSNNSDLHIESKLQVPKESLYPVYTVRLTSISQDQAAALLTRITSGGFVSSFTGTTKANILDAVQHTENAKANVMHDSDLLPEEQHEIIDEYDDIIADLMNQYDNAPSNPDPIYDLTEIDRTTASIFTSDGAKIGSVFMQLQDKYKDGVSGSKIIIDIDLNDRCLIYYPDAFFDSMESCSLFCNQLFSDEGITDYVLSESFENNLFYTLHFVKCYNGILYTPTRRYDGAAYDGEYYSEYIPDESIVIVFGKGTSCIRAFDWYSPSEIVSCINDNVQLLPFEDILTLFKNHCKAIASWDPDSGDGIIKQDIIISSIRLGYKRIPIKNSYGEFMVVPAWAFSGTIQLTCDPINCPYKLDENNQVNISLGSDGLCAVINAIDGSIIYSGIRDQ